VTTFNFPIQRAVKLNHDCKIEPFFPDHIFSRSQDLEEAYHDAGQFYWGQSEAYLNDSSLYFSGALPVVLPRCLVQDVDTLEDWEQAEFMYHAIRAKGNSN
jgi:N-acylneuraminate cytidylyltransferase